jgi:hypothetical protein
MGGRSPKRVDGRPLARARRDLAAMATVVLLAKATMDLLPIARRHPMLGAVD